MAPQQPQVPTITTQQIVDSAQAGIQLFGLDTTLIPGNLRRQVAVLEAVLNGIGTGSLQVVSPPKMPVESQADAEGKGNSDLPDEDSKDGDTHTTPA